ncbi:molybdopterin oxidoreductase [Thermococci archaeon]|nr:MAG: molybdopterin oxidoreductase [Thermococci archaeon]
MSEIRHFKLTCIICPLGCEIEVKMEGDKIVEITGFGCPKGRDYAIQEVIAPKRVVMSVIKVNKGDFPTVSVKTDKPVPKELIPVIMKELAKIEVEAPVKIGQVIIGNVANSGANIIATRPSRKVLPVS